MKASSLESKTVRPGLNSYSFYHSDRHVASASAPVINAHSAAKNRIAVLVIVALAIVAGVALNSHQDSSAKTASQAGTPLQATSTATNAPKSSAPALAAVSRGNHCATNRLPKFIVVDVSDRHLWACEGSKTVHDSPVITGMEAQASTVSPRGTFKIYGKISDTVLTGADETGSWRLPVAYWMPYLDNQYGTYGFHDASSRNPSEFGAVDPKSSKASHGCVELPHGTAAWIYNWSSVGTTVTVVS